ncbi:proteasome complex subunit Rpn13 ubiquitin receptor-domain-containing protein [Lipomyces doorenjongii]|uniref:proteasome complex subunit Rpn13 ubiquitin receptor-domain-containing protein n=1 Tax=Lipomyces doorenjongii TaxID=383834 RepID=UPI0034CF194B
MSDQITLLTFKAGRVDFNPPSKHLKPLPQKGKITVSRSNDEDAPLLSFVWEPRGSSKNDPSVERDELMIFPGEAEWLPVSQCKTGRVYVLKFNSSSQRSFFWLQDPPAGDKLDEISGADLKIATRINTLLEDVFADEVDITQDANESAAPNGDDVEMADSASPSNNTTTQTPNLTNLLRSIVIPSGESGSATNSADIPASSTPILNITDAITPSQIVSYASSLDESDPKLTNLYNLLPSEIPHNKYELLRVLQSPQFLQGLNSLSSTLHSSEGYNVGRLVSQELGMPYRGEGIEGFLRGVLAALDEEQHPDADDDGNEEMQE